MPVGPGSERREGMEVNVHVVVEMHVCEHVCTHTWKGGRRKNLSPGGKKCHVATTIVSERRRFMCTCMYALDVCARHCVCTCTCI